MYETGGHSEVASIFIYLPNMYLEQKFSLRVKEIHFGCKVKCLNVASVVQH